MVLEEVGSCQPPCGRNLYGDPAATPAAGVCPYLPFVRPFVQPTPHHTFADMRSCSYGQWSLTSSSCHLVHFMSLLHRYDRIMVKMAPLTHLIFSLGTSKSIQNVHHDHVPCQGAKQHCRRQNSILDKGRTTKHRRHCIHVPLSDTNIRPFESCANQSTMICHIALALVLIPTNTT